jgi:integrase
MTRPFQYQKGFVSDPINTKRGVAFKIRYRVPAAGGKTRHICETLYGLKGKKAAREVLEDRIRKSASDPRLMKPSEMTLGEFIETIWKPGLERKGIRPSTMYGYDALLRRHILLALGSHKTAEIAPLHIEQIAQKKLGKHSPKSIRNILMTMRGIFRNAVEQDVIPRSPVRDAHMPVITKKEKPVWSPEQVLRIIENAPMRFRVLITVDALTGIRLGELLALQ